MNLLDEYVALRALVGDLQTRVSQIEEQRKLEKSMQVFHEPRLCKCCKKVITDAQKSSRIFCNGKCRSLYYMRQRRVKQQTELGKS